MHRLRKRNRPIVREVSKRLRTTPMSKGRRASDASPARFVVIGGGVAGVSCVETLLALLAADAHAEEGGGASGQDPPPHDDGDCPLLHSVVLLTATSTLKTSSEVRLGKILTEVQVMSASATSLLEQQREVAAEARCALEVVGASAARLLAVKFLANMNPAADVLALASLEVDISSLQPGNCMIVKWRGKPVFIRARTGAWRALLHH